MLNPLLKQRKHGEVSAWLCPNHAGLSRGIQIPAPALRWGQSLQPWPGAAEIGGPARSDSPAAAGSTLTPRRECILLPNAQYRNSQK